MTALGIIFISAGFICWVVGAGKVTTRALNRLGIERTWELNPVAPFSIPFRKFNGQEWGWLALTFVASMSLLILGRYFLTST